MAFKMEGEDAHKRGEEVKDRTDKVMDAKGTDADVSKDLHLFARERNMLLLSALYKLYGEEWEKSPDWTRVSEEIKSAKILGFGEHFTPDSCELQYKTLLEGYRLGFPDNSIQIKVPRVLTEAQKRQWILATTVADIGNTSKLLDAKIRDLYAKELSAIDSTPTTSTGDINDEKTLKLFGLSKDELGREDDTEEDEFEIDETEEMAVDIAQTEVIESIVGFKDVLHLNKYCLEAVEHSNSKFPGLMALISDESSEVKDASLKKSDMSADITKGSVPNTQGPRDTPERDSKFVKEVEMMDSTISSKSPSKVLTEGQDKVANEKPAEHVNSNDPDKKAITDVEQALEKGTMPQSAPECISPTSSIRDTNGRESSSDLRSKSPARVDSKQDKEVSEPVQKNLKKETDADGDFKMRDNVKDEVSNADIGSTGEVDGKLQVSSPVKDKMNRKSSGPPKSTTKRTTSGLISPEPTEKLPTEDDKNVKKTPSRQTSSESNLPALRSRRGATPTKASAPEADSAKSTPIGSKPNITEDDEEENFLTPRTTPESPSMKSDLETVIETKPPVKTYSAKPPSPLTHVDPNILAQFDDEDDPELTLIDSNINQTKTDKVVPKVCTKRGGTGSSEHTSEMVAEENAQNKRSTKKTGSSDDLEDMEGNGTNDDGPNKRLTRRSLKIHDAANEQQTDAVQTGSEKAASESSYSGKDKKSRSSKVAMMRLKNLQEEKVRMFGDGEESPEGQRLTRARAKTSSTPQDKRSKPSSVGDCEGLSESEPTSARATRSRSSTASSMPVLEPTVNAVLLDDEEQKVFRKNALAFVEKVENTELATQLLQYIHDDPHKICKRYVDFALIKSKIEEGKSRTFSSVYLDLTYMMVNAAMAHPTNTQASDIAGAFKNLVKPMYEDWKNPQNSSQRNDNSDEESLESHDEQRSESSSKQATSRRRRRRSASETSEEVLPVENKRRVTRTSASSANQLGGRKAKHPISPDIVSANRGRR